jgi:hypothetical protein
MLSVNGNEVELFAEEKWFVRWADESWWGWL